MGPNFWFLKDSLPPRAQPSFFVNFTNGQISLFQAEILPYKLMHESVTDSWILGGGKRFLGQRHHPASKTSIIFVSIPFTHQVPQGVMQKGPHGCLHMQWVLLQEKNEPVLCARKRHYLIPPGYLLQHNPETWPSKE